MTIAAILLALALAGALAWAGYLFASRAALVKDRERLTADLARCERDIQAHLAQTDQQRADLADRDRQIAARDNTITEYRAKLEGLDDKFRALAQEVLKQANEQFLQLAEQKFKGEQKDAAAQLEQRKQSIEAMLKPIRESLDKHAHAVGEIEKSREGAYHALRQQLISMLEDQKALRGETSNLVKALRRPDVRGRWGEMQLRRVAELAGMIDHCDFEEQPTVGVERNQRPDMIVKLPAGRQIVVDSKAPIDAYLSAIEATDDGEREEQFTRFTRHVETKIDELAAKSYQSQLDRCTDFVVLFIPGESFLQAAMQRRPDLMERAFNRGVVIATPSILIALLKAVAIGWREEQIAENAMHIAELGKELHNRIGTAISHLDKLGKAVESTVKNYNAFVGSIESSVLPQARRFKDLQADSPKELPADGEVKVVELQPRELRAIESVDS